MLVSPLLSIGNVRKPAVKFAGVRSVGRVRRFPCGKVKIWVETDGRPGLKCPSPSSTLRKVCPCPAFVISPVRRLRSVTKVYLPRQGRSTLAASAARHHGHHRLQVQAEHPEGPCALIDGKITLNSPPPPPPLDQGVGQGHQDGPGHQAGEAPVQGRRRRLRARHRSKSAGDPSPS